MVKKLTSSLGPLKSRPSMSTSGSVFVGWGGGSCLGRGACEGNRSFRTERGTGEQFLEDSSEMEFVVDVLGWEPCELEFWERGVRRTDEVEKEEEDKLGKDLFVSRETIFWVSESHPAKSGTEGKK